MPVHALRNDALRNDALTTHALTAGACSGLAPDPALPARDELLQPALVADLLSGLLGGGRLDVSGAELIRVKYRIGESLRVLYRLNVAGRAHMVSGRMLAGGRSASAHRKAARGALPSEALRADGLRADGGRADGLRVDGGRADGGRADGGRADGLRADALPATCLPATGWRATALDPGRDTVWWTFPNDRRLVGLDAALDPARLPAALRKRVGRWSRSAVVHYTPERSMTLQALDPDGQALAFVKCYAPHTQDVAQLAARYDLFASRLRTADPALRSPRALAHCGERRLLVLEPMPGRSWLDLDRSGVIEALRRLGRAIAVVHATPLGADAGLGMGIARFGRLDLARVTRAGELVSQARPEVAGAAWRLTNRLASDPPEQQEQVLLHGDCHPGNVLVTGDRLSLIDLDQAGIGPGATDIASLLARLTYGAVLGERDAATTTLMARAFLDGYSQVRALPDIRTLRWYAAAALLAERSLRAVSRVRPEALGRLEDLIGAGHDLLDGRRRL